MQCNAALAAETAPIGHVIEGSARREEVNSSVTEKILINL
jgi:hypothetical protein